MNQLAYLFFGKPYPLPFSFEEDKYEPKTFEEIRTERIDAARLRIFNELTYEWKSARQIAAKLEKSKNAVHNQMRRFLEQGKVEESQLWDRTKVWRLKN